MGIRKIEDEIDLKEAMKKKAAELKIKDMEAKASVEKFTKDKLVLASEIETARIEGREVHGYMQRMFPDYSWLWNNDVLDRACYLADQEYQPIVHNLVDNYDFSKMYRTLVRLCDMDFFRHYPEREFDRLIVVSDKPLREDITWIPNYPMVSDDGYDTSVLFAPCNFLNMGSPLHDLPVLVLKDGIGKSNLFFKAKTTAEDLTREKDELIRKEVFKLREKEKNFEEEKDELEIAYEGQRRMYKLLKDKMLTRAPYAVEEEFEKFEKDEMLKKLPYRETNRKRTILWIIVIIAVVLLLSFLISIFYANLSKSATMPELANTIINSLNWWN